MQFVFVHTEGVQGSEFFHGSGLHGLHAFYRFGVGQEVINANPLETEFLLGYNVFAEESGQDDRWLTLFSHARREVHNETFKLISVEQQGGYVVRVAHRVVMGKSE